MTIKLSSEQEHAQAVRQAVDSIVKELRRISALPDASSELSATLDRVANNLRDATALPDSAVSRSEIADQP